MEKEEFTYCGAIWDSFQIELEFKDETPSASDEFNEYLSLRKQRLEENGLRGEYVFGDGRDSIISNQRSNSISESDGKKVDIIENTRYRQNIPVSREYYRGYKRVYRRKRNLTMYANTEKRQSINDGIEAKAEEKITDFFRYYAAVPSDKCIDITVKIVKYSALVLGILIFAAGLIAWGLANWWVPLVIGILCSVLLLCAAWFVLALPYLLYLIILMIITFPLYISCFINNRRALNNLSDSETFCTEYFEEKAVPLAKLIMLSKPGSSPYYSGEPLQDDFSAVVEASYRGSCKIISASVDENKAEAELKLYFVNTVLKGKRLRDRRSVVQLKMQRCAEHPEFSPGLKGWTVTEMRKIK